jgi:outer membrane protein
MNSPPSAALTLAACLLMMAGMCGISNTWASPMSLETPPTLNVSLDREVCEFPPSLDDLALQDAVHIALCQAPTVRQATQTVQEHQAEVDVARAKYFPTLDISANTSRSAKHLRYPGHSIGNHDLYANRGNARLGLNWLLFDSGGRGAQVDHARANLAAALYNKVLVNRNHAVMVATAYYKASSTQASALAAKEASARAEKNFLATQRLREGGVGSVADELLAKVAWQRTLIDSETKTSQATAARMSLASAMGLAAHTPISLPTPVRTDSAMTTATSTANASPSAPNAASATRRAGATKPSGPRAKQAASAPQTPGIIQGSPASDALMDQINAAVGQHPRLALARAKTQAAAAQAQSIYAQNLPRLSLQADRDLGVTRPSDADARQNVNSWSVGLNLQIPLFDGMATRYATSAADAKVRAARDTERSVWFEEELTLLTDVNHLTSTVGKAALLNAAEASAELAYRSAQVRYQQGVGTAIELLKAQDELSNIKQSNIEVHYELLATQFRVALALDTLPAAETGTAVGTDTGADTGAEMETAAKPFTGTTLGDHREVAH